jgi:hypothetical protein
MPGSREDERGERDMSFEEQRASIEQHGTEVRKVLQLSREGADL